MGIHSYALVVCSVDFSILEVIKKRNNVDETNSDVY